MQSNSETQSKTSRHPRGTLTRAIQKSEQAKELVEECAVELASVNEDIMHEIETLAPAPGMQSVLGKNETIEEKVQDACKKLELVNDALADQVRERDMLEHQFEAAVEQGEASSHAALHDVLTDLPNRALFNDRLEHGLAQAIRHHWTLAVMFLDLDDFKKINDTYGHDAGDDVLRTIAGRLKEITRMDDTVCRYGGDEFVCLLMQAKDDKHLTVIAQSIIQAIQTPCKITTGDDHVHVSIQSSIGIAMFPKDGVSAAALMKSADGAMYLAKQNSAGYAFAR